MSAAGGTVDLMRALEADWTAAAGRSNSSRLFEDLSYAVEQLIRGDAHSLISGRADKTARLIVAQLAHEHGLAPRPVRPELQFVAMNIVNQLFDLAEVPVEKRQAINDEADSFVYRLLRELVEP